MEQEVGREERESRTLPVVEERLEVGKRTVVRSAVRVRKVVDEHDETVEVPLERRRVEVERVEVNRYVDEVPPDRTEGETLIVPVVEEVLVVEKRLVLREELRITTRVEQHVEKKEVTLRRERVEVEREAVGGEGILEEV